MAEDLYKTLGVSRSASTAEIKKAYREIARKYHPDKNPGDESAAQIFAAAAEAYRVLGDRDLRSKYDNYGRQSAGQASTEDPGEVFGDIFGSRSRGGGGSAAQRPQQPQQPQQPPRRAPAADQWQSGPAPSRGGPRGEDLRYTLELDFEDAALGCERRINVPRHERCGGCGGTGAQTGTAPVICQACGGTGSRREEQGFFTSNVRCDQCDGAGKIIPQSCGHCRGSGTRRVNRGLTVRVPAGCEPGTRLRMQGEGEVGSGGAPGDLYVVVQYKPHPFFKREEDDLVAEVPVRFSEAALGATIEVPTLEGPVRMRIPPGSQSGRVFRLKGKGLPAINGRGRGDQRVRIVVEVPTYVSDEQRHLLQQWAELEEDHDQNPMVRDYLHSLDDYYGEEPPPSPSRGSGWGD